MPAAGGGRGIIRSQERATLPSLTQRFAGEVDESARLEVLLLQRAMQVGVRSQRAKAASGASQQHKVAATASTGVSGEAISPDADPVSALPLVVMTFEEPPASASLDAWGRPPPLSAEQPGMRSKVALVQQLLARGYRVVLLPAPGQGQGQGGTRPGPARSLRLHALIHFEAALGSSAYARDLRVLTVFKEWTDWPSVWALYARALVVYSERLRPAALAVSTGAPTLLRLAAARLGVSMAFGGLGVRVQALGNEQDPDGEGLYDLETYRAGLLLARLERLAHDHLQQLGLQIGGQQRQLLPAAS